MFLTVHAPAGMWVGTIIPNVPAALLVGMVSHFLLDRVPHYDPPMPPGTINDGVLKNQIFQRFVGIALADSVLAIAVTAALVGRLPDRPAWPMLWGAVGGILPDLLFGLYRLTAHPWLAAFHRFHEANHFDPKKIPVTFGVGMATQLITFALMLGLLFW